MSKNILRVSLSDIELFEGCRLNKNDINCLVYLNGNCIDKIYYQYKDHQSSLTLTHQNDSVQLVVQNKQSNDLIGCISFPASTFLAMKGKSFTQWFVKKCYFSYEFV